MYEKIYIYIIKLYVDHTYCSLADIHFEDYHDSWKRKRHQIAIFLQ